MNIKQLVKITCKEIKPETIIFTEKTRLWCNLPYNGHNGCPNFGKNPQCPPNAPYLDQIPKLFSHYYLIYAQFDFKTYKEQMRSLYPDWSEKQLACLLYWQKPLKNLLTDYLHTIANSDKTIYGAGSGSNGCYAMESIGIHVFKTLDLNQIHYEIKPVNSIIMVNLVCLHQPIQYKLKINGLSNY